MKIEMRRRLARESFEEKIRKAGQLVTLAKNFPRQPLSPAAQLAAAEKEKAIIAAISDQKVLEFSYNGQSRIVEPQTYGISTAGHPILRGYQRSGGSVSGYTKGLRLFELRKISRLRDTGERFSEAHPEHNPNDSAMSTVIVSLPLRSRSGAYLKGD
jgi:predicted DNA-binding transcriptional regulator YafY